ncbi:MAG TPA: ATP-binding protein [Ktedonobacteraceae bacterium]|nr:ATP-binding protein [Ktedonobacteraceae bacterium]
MAKMTHFSSFAKWHTFFTIRWLVILAGLAIQLIALGVVLANLDRPAGADITLTPVAGSPGVCQVVALRPFSDPWVRGLQADLQIRIEGASPEHPCAITTPKLTIDVVGLPASAHALETTVLPAPVDFLDLALVLCLASIFNVTGIAIFLRSQNRPLARITYTLFSCTALILCLLNLRGADYFWFNLLGFTIAMLTRGLSVTFVCLFAYPIEAKQTRRRPLLLPYLPLLAGVVMAVCSLFMSIMPISWRLTFMGLGLIYNAACVLVIIGVVAWGLRRLTHQERKFVRMVVVGLMFLLIPLILNLDIIKTDAVTQTSLIRLIPIPLAVLPLACDYALFRQHLLGTTSMLSRKAMRGLLWLLLANAFLFPSIILLRVLNTLHITQESMDYVYGALILVNLICFPLLWSKVRDAGDQVFYQDFYEYNRSLRDLSAALTHLQGIEQISDFMLPRLARLLNATEAGLLLRTSPHKNGLATLSMSPKADAGWRLYRHISPKNRQVSHALPNGLPGERLIGIANLALTHLNQASPEPLLLDGVLLLALYDGDRCSGFLYLGAKLNLELYNKEDRSFLSTLASQLSVLEVNSRYLEQAQADAQQMAALTHRVISAQEEERRHLALELHDEALQQAMLVVRQLSDASNMAEVAEVMPLARSVVSSLRQTCLELRPPLLDELGLAEAFRWLAGQMEERSGGQLSIHITCQGDWFTRLPADVELAFYRVGQEALSNVLKYARASQVALRLRREDNDTVALLIADNGRGLQQRRPLAENLGLAGMHERMAAIGGSLQMRSSSGRGVVIRALYPPARAAASPRQATSILSRLENQPEPAFVWEGMRA